MLKLVLLPMVAVIFLSACSTNQPPSKFNTEGDYIGWHCAADNDAPSDWHCEQKTKIAKAITAKTAKSSDTKDSVLAKAEMPPNLTDGSNKAFDNKSEIASQENKITSSSIVGIAKNIGYQLQLGAYVSEKDARAAAKQLIAVSDIRIFPLWSNQRQFFVLLYGHYKSRNAAQEAALLLMETNPALNYWIRTSASIEKARAR